MTPKQEAEQLVREMYAVHSNSASDITLHFAKECALIAVDEILEEFDHFPFNDDEYLTNNRQYWQQVKQEIETYGGNKQ